MQCFPLQRGLVKGRGAGVFGGSFAAPKYTCKAKRAPLKPAATVFQDFAGRLEHCFTRWLGVVRNGTDVGPYGLGLDSAQKFVRGR